MLAEVVAALACPVCGGGLQQADRSLTCGQGHLFDVARRGYVTLRSTAGPRHVGDGPDMVDARVRFLGSGAYDGLAARIAEACANAYPGGGLILDAGGGTGFYAQRVLDGLVADARWAQDPTTLSPGLDDLALPRTEPIGLVLDASPAALGRAARAHARLGAVGCDLWQRWPLRDGTAGVVLDVFAPRNGLETARVLVPDGSLITVTPGPGHLAELIEPLGLLAVDPDKDDRVDRSLGPYLHRERAEPYEQGVLLDHRGLSALIAMGPSARHLGPDELARRLASLPSEIELTVSVLIAQWRRPSARLAEQ